MVSQVFFTHQNFSYVGYYLVSLTPRHGTVSSKISFQEGHPCSVTGVPTDGDEIILNPDDHGYFGYVALDLISERIGKVTCQICGETYNAGQLKEFALGHGKSLFDINQKQKGGIRLLEKRKNPSMFGGKGYKCPAGHVLISMETWRT
jgi:hypothetical protein